MKQLGLLLRHELRSLAADRLLWVVVPVLVLLGCYATLVGVRFVEGQRASAAAAQAGEAERYELLAGRLAEAHAGTWTGSDSANPTWPYVLGRAQGQRVAVLPASVFQATAVGQENLVPTVVPVSLDGAEVRGSQEQIENPLHLLSGNFDVAFLVVFVAPLLLIGASFDLISGERERGSLAMVLSQPTTAQRLVFAKALARWLLLVGTCAVTVWCALTVAGEPPPTARFLLWTATVGAYFGFWLALAALVNAGSGSSARNAITLVVAWLGFVAVVPAVIHTGAQAIHPVPTRAEFVGAEREQTRDVQRQGDAVLAQYMQDHPELAPASLADTGDFQRQAFAVQEAIENRLAPLQQAYDRQRGEQRALVETLRWLSPAVLAHDVLLQAAGTGDARLRAFEREVAAYYERWRAFFAAAIYGGKRMAPDDLSRLPAWSFDDERTADAVVRALPSLVGLVVLALLVAGAAGWRLAGGGGWSP